MSEQDLNDIEERLAAMKPAEPDPAVKQRIAQSLEQDAGQSDRPLIFRGPWAFVTAAAAVIALALVLLPLIGQIPTTPPVAIDPGTTAPSVDEQTDEPSDALDAIDPLKPTLLAMHQALRESPEALEQLIDQAGALAALPATDQPQPIPTASATWGRVQNEELQ